MNIGWTDKMIAHMNLTGFSRSGRKNGSTSWTRNGNQVLYAYGGRSILEVQIVS